ncbi:hypothetical protein BWI17_06975 [Betaproteobacteria bacterium GR16-43]|nr:hypothetical protein BWI17_06975 [Betaproteobacteria bacterium GR16-43]
MHRSGDDLTVKRDMDFAFLFPEEGRARAFERKAAAMGYEVDVSWFKEKRAWDVQCTIELVPTHVNVTRIEGELSAVAATEGGRPDGWGCVAQ